MRVEITERARHATGIFYGLDQDVVKLLEVRLEPIAKEIGADAKSRAAAHIRFLGLVKPGSYVNSIYGALARQRKNRALAFVRSGHPLAHLMEYGFTITDMMITVRNARVMKFAGVDDSGRYAWMFRRSIHRHQTQVQPYPAILPAFEARRAEIMAILSGIPKQVQTSHG
jgi:hypothetical protein